MPVERSLRSWKHPPPLQQPSHSYNQCLSPSIPFPIQSTHSTHLILDSSWLPSPNTPHFDPYAEEDGPPPLVEPPQESLDDDLPPLVEPSPDGHISYFLPPSADDAFSPALQEPVTPDEEEFETPAVAKPSHHKKRPPGHIPRPPNAFILYRAHFIKAQVNYNTIAPLGNLLPPFQHIPGHIEPNNNTLSTIAGLCWKKLSDEERETWKEKARKAKEEHMKKYPTYRYNPRDQQNRAKSAGSAKRKVKEISGPPPDPERCQEIARMLVEGKKGNELADAIKHFDASSSKAPGQQVMPTRFDAPMTEKSFRRRSSSVPPSSKDNEDAVTPPPKSRPKRLVRKRSSSAGTNIAVERKKKASTRSAKTEEAESSSPSVGQVEQPFPYYTSKAAVSQSS
jgi:hypothetical protein